MSGLYLVTSGLMCIVFLGFMLGRGITFGTGAAWVVLTCVHGLLFKPLFVYFNIPNAALLDELLFRGVSRDEYWEWGLISLPAYALFFSSMIVAGRYSARIPNVNHYNAQPYSNLRLALFLLIALVGFVGFFIQFPDLLDAGVSKNRIATTELSDYDSGGIWRYLVAFSYIVSLCALVNAGFSEHRRSSFALFFVAVLLWLPFCYLSDQRGLIFFSAVTYLIALNRYVSKVSLSYFVAVIGGVVALVVIRTITRIRLGGAEVLETVAQTLGNLVGQNFIEHAKMVSIIKAIPEQLDYQYGLSYLNSILILVPRSLFPDKPFVNLDTTIGQVVFGCHAFGACAVPPGLLAESYLNFGVPGLFIMPVVVGALIGNLDRQYRITSPHSMFHIFYLLCGLYLGMAVLGSGISSSITQLVGQSLSVALVCFVCRRLVVAPAPATATGDKAERHALASRI